ncbi:hypothetical protein [Bradyrhizobium lablabi]|uniref:hypothetical protein n=1 Tax=Bradyrhizobium lablabi TaxID=722472 RepID=UPI001BA57309|nr:hypothetical protein [Bradyrhizobium lablabi]MBR0695981.1 hypothetical protein [Bradyrhizobium lablabi]
MFARVGVKRVLNRGKSKPELERETEALRGKPLRLDRRLAVRAAAFCRTIMGDIAPSVGLPSVLFAEAGSRADTTRKCRDNKYSDSFQQRLEPLQFCLSKERLRKMEFQATGGLVPSRARHTLSLNNPSISGGATPRKISLK